ncbi:hypothetical protein PMI25_003635 [Pseudomonas sp. GM30]|nr:hypothetical protein PMI25_003635 [Pseudomonas sp. GM30]
MIHYSIVSFFLDSIRIESDVVVIKRAFTFIIGKFVYPAFFAWVDLCTAWTQWIGRCWYRIILLLTAL